MSRLNPIVALFFVLLALVGAGRLQAVAHEMRPAYLQLAQTTPDQYQVIWKVPARGTDQRLGLYLSFADDVSVKDRVAAFIGGGHVQRMTVEREGGLTGSPITIDGLSGTFTDALLRLERLDGGELTHRLTPDSPTYIVEAEPIAFRVAWTYFVLGVEHILLGIDHLLFVLALLLIVGDWRKLFWTITAFTIAHSITLALATLGMVNVPGPPVEAIIALSIVFVAAEILRGRQGSPSLTAQWPWLVSFTFGLLHGFGFAGALSEVGLPQSSIPLALLTFNLGVEAGQLTFVATAVLIYTLLRRVRFKPPEWMKLIPAYAIGGVAAFWVIERTLGFWGG